MICARVVTCISSCAACQFNSCSAAGAKARASYVGASATCSVSSVMLHGYEQVAAGGLPSARTCTQLTMHDLPSWPDAMHWGLSFWRCTVGPEFWGIWRPSNLMLWCAPAFMQLFWGMGFERSTTDLANQPPCDTAGAGHTAIFLSCVQRLWRGCSVPLSDVAITCYPGQSPSHASNLFWSDRSGNHIHRFVFAVLVSLRI